ncbi:MAG: glucosyl-3-phosphoglycerate synthase, partial [Methanosarcinales archaeon]
RCNNLRYNRHLEESTVDTFSNIIISAGKEYINQPIGMLLPDWTRAISAMPTIRKKLRDAAYLDLDIK